jgi:hypothetical protein
MLERMGHWQDANLLTEILWKGHRASYYDLVFGKALVQRGIVDPRLSILARNYGLTSEGLAVLPLPDDSMPLQPIAERLAGDWDERAKLFEGLFDHTLDLALTWSFNLSLKKSMDPWWKEIWWS